MIRNREVAVKNAPATGRLNCRVTITVTPRVATAEMAAPARFSVLPLATPASPDPPPLRPGPALPGPAGTPPVWPGPARSGPALSVGPAWSCLALPAGSALFCSAPSAGPAWSGLAVPVLSGPGSGWPGLARAGSPDTRPAPDPDSA